MLMLWFVANTILWPYSVKVGTLKLDLNVILVSLAGAGWLAKKMRISGSAARLGLLCSSYLCFSFLIAASGPCVGHLPKLILSMPVLVFLVALGYDVGRKASVADWMSLTKAAQVILVVALAGFMCELAVPTWFPITENYRAEGKLSGLFDEPSHAAICLFPSIGMLLVSENRELRRRGWFALAVLLVISRSSTLIAFIAAWIVYRLFVQQKLRRGIVVLSMIAALITLSAAINYDRLIQPTVMRIVGVVKPTDTDNLSSLIYVQGWQDAWYYLKATHGFGVGLNLMGCGPLPDVPARSAARIVFQDGDLNAEDGSFLFAKVLSECGVLAIVLYFVLTAWWVGMEKTLRKSRERPLIVGPMRIWGVFLFCFYATSFIRGLGYFEGCLLVMVAAVGGAEAQKRINKLRTAANCTYEAIALPKLNTS